MVMTCTSGMGDVVLRERLPLLWQRIEDAHYSYLETDDSPEKLQQKKKLEDYVIEYLSLVPHECKFGLTETGKVFQRTVNELPNYSAYRAGLGWAALARYAGNLLAQPWRKEYKVIRLYCGYFKHEVEANMVGAELLLHAMGYKSIGSGRLALDAPICPDMVAAVSRDAIIAQCECQIMCHMWESVWGNGSRVTWGEIARERAHGLHSHPNGKRPYNDGLDIYANVATTISPEPHHSRVVDVRNHNNTVPQYSRPYEETSLDEPVPMVHMVPANVPHLMYHVPHQRVHDVPVTIPQCSTVPVIPHYGVPCYYPVQAPYMIPTQVYPTIKHANNVPVNGFPPVPQYRYPSVPTAQLIELETPSVYENGRFDRYRDDERGHKRRDNDSSRRNSTSKSGFSDVTLPSLPRSDTQPALSKAKEDGMGTYESWDYVFRNLSSKEQDGEGRSRFSPSFDRDSRTLDRFDREDRRSKYQPTTLDLEDGLQALNLDRSHDEEVYRTAKVNENLMRMKQEQELKRAKQLAKKQAEDRKTKKLEPIGNPKADALIPNKVAPDKVKLLTKREIRDRKDTIRQQNSVNGSVQTTAEVKKVKKPAKLVAQEIEKPRNRSIENGVPNSVPSSRMNSGASSSLAQLTVSLDEPDHSGQGRSPPKQPHVNGDRDRPPSNGSAQDRDRPPQPSAARNKWECATCTYLNKEAVAACEMCGKSKRAAEIQPLTSGGRECPACTLVNQREARLCDACGTSLQHCPTYI